MKRQKSANTKSNQENSKATKSLSVRYAELLKLREAVLKTQSDLQFASNVERPTAKAERAFPHH